MRIIKFFIVFPILLFTNLIYADHKFTETNKNSLIKFFCIRNVKSEFESNNMNYIDRFGEEICNCYLNNIFDNVNHKDAISQCKLENKKKFNL